MGLGAAFVRVSTGSQDETSQIKAINTAAKERGITIVKTFRLRGYSASKGMQEPALHEAIADIERGDYESLIVTESSRLDRREDLDAQAEILLSIRSAGGDVISLTEPEFGKTDFTGRLFTLVRQQANAEKSKTVKSETYRGISMVRDNRACYGPLLSFWKTRGSRYHKQAYCADSQAVNDIYERVARSESLSAIGRMYDLYPASVRNIVRFEAHYTGVMECGYRYKGVRETWTHEVEPVVDSALWWRANNTLDANQTPLRANKGGRPVASPANWVSGILSCPECGGSLYLLKGLTPAGNARTPKLRCGGRGKKRVTCGKFQPCDAEPVIDLIENMFAHDTGDILAFQRVAGNAHELDELKAEFRKVQMRFAAATDDDVFSALVAARTEIKERMEAFTVVPDRYDYAPTGQTVAQMWDSGDDAARRGMARAVQNAYGMSLAFQGGEPRIVIGVDSNRVTDVDGIVDLGNGLCFRRQAAQVA